MIALILVFAALIIAAVLLWFNLGKHTHRFVAAMIGLQAMQISAMFGRLELDWGKFADAYFNTLSILNVNLQLSSPECSFSRKVDAWMVIWLLTMALPLFAAIAVAIASLGATLLRRWSGAEILDGARRAWVQALTLLYLPLIMMALSLFGCRRDESGRWILIVTPSRLCYDARWWRLFGPALFFSLLYCFVLPGGLFWWLSRARRALDSVAFALRYGFLVGRFNSRYWYFEVFNLGTKFGVVACMTFFASDSGRASGAFMVLACTAMTVTKASPYRSPFHNWLATGATAATASVIFGGIVSDFLMRRFIVIGGIIVTVLVIVVGNLIDLWLMAAADKVASRFFKASEIAYQEGSMSDSDATGFKGNVRRSVSGSESTMIHQAQPESYEDALKSIELAQVDTESFPRMPATGATSSTVALSTSSATNSGPRR
eukprot:c19785_g2_i1.p1 GENE.c19785_g2_i1~~c19785_g2_i1.p1  ORF type:complete len:475 (-),score=84.28 c19785_g2_i1:48-1343(-)